MGTEQIKTPLPWWKGWPKIASDGGIIVMTFTMVMATIIFIALYTGIQTIREKRHAELELLSAAQKTLERVEQQDAALRVLVNIESPLEMLLASESERLGCDLQMDHVTRQMAVTREIESEGIPGRVSSSGAYGQWGFKPPSVTMVARYFQDDYAVSYWGNTPEWITEIARGDGQNLNLTDDQWQVLVLGHAIRRAGSDPLLRESLCDGNRDAAFALYGEHHHTNPDTNTIARMEVKFHLVYGN